MKKNMIYMAALAVMTAACSNEDDTFVTSPQNNNAPGEVRMITETITATNGDAPTRAAIADADGAFTWTAGDNIAVHVSNGTTYKYVSTADEEASGADQSGAEASFTVAYEEGYSRDAFAVFPASIVATDAANYGQSGSALDVTLPSSYTLAQVSGTNTTCPMIAKNEAGSDWEFYQLCGLLRLTVNNIPATTKRLEIDFDSKKVCGTFSIASPTPGTSKIETSTDAANDKISVIKDGTDAVLGSESLVLNLPLPTGTYTNVIVIAYDALSGGDPTILDVISFSKAVTRAGGKKKTSSLTQKVFSVSDTKHVIFSPGNLQATTNDLGTTWTWSFAPTQYTAIKNNIANTTITGKGTVSENGTIDLFSYSTENENNFFGIIKSKRDNYYPDSPTRGAFKDWGENSISGYAANFWYTMEKSKWEYLLNTRTAPKFAKAEVCGVYGLLIFPDNFVWVTSIMGGVPSTVDQSNGNYNSTNCSIASTEWKYLEAAGVTFLPGTGYRSQNENSVSNLSPARGYYWFSDTNGTQSGSGTTYDNNSTYYLYFLQGGMATTYSHSKRCGCSVRLVHNVD